MWNLRKKLYYFILYNYLLILIYDILIRKYIKCKVIHSLILSPYLWQYHNKNYHLCKLMRIQFVMEHREKTVCQFFLSLIHDTAPKFFTIKPGWYWPFSDINASNWLIRENVVQISEHFEDDHIYRCSK